MNLNIFYVAILYLVMVNSHYGWTFTPTSGVQMICDGIAMIILAISLIQKKEKTW